MLFADLVAASRRIAATAARSEKVAILASVLRRLDPAEIEAGVAFLTGRPRQGKVGLGWAALSAAMKPDVSVARGGGPEDSQPRLASAAIQAELFGPFPADTHPRPPQGLPRRLTVSEVDRTFESIARRSGPGSMSRRSEALAALLREAAPGEREFIGSLVLGELRQGALAGLMEEAVARAAELPADTMRKAVMLAGDLGVVARAALTEGPAGLARFRLRLFRPLQPMLARPAEDLDDALRRLGEARLEFKLDGARVQVHKAGGEVRVFSRRLNDVTAGVPELVDRVRGLPARELILDGEAIALDARGIAHPFQVTMRRFGRKLDVEQIRRQLPLTPFFFDLLHLDGDDLLDAPARDRFRALLEAAPELVVPQRVTAEPAVAAAFLDEALRRGHEGVMAKAMGARYEAGSRGFGWLKVKGALTLDLVVLAAEWGHGRRARWLSNIHLGARDPAGGGFAMLGKTFKGMTDEMLAWQTERFQQLAMATEGHVVHLSPAQVVEVAFSDVQESPQYAAGMALRFARVKRYRDDKSAADADTVDAVRAILESQRGKGRG